MFNLHFSFQLSKKQTKSESKFSDERMFNQRFHFDTFSLINFILLFIHLPHIPINGVWGSLFGCETKIDFSFHINEQNIFQLKLISCQ
jgi:hypothetical protein